tara:strand:- start:8383 stop:8670 length:288 start_codon:yes stop_codon:yes gene_type:complete
MLLIDRIREAYLCEKDYSDTIMTANAQGMKPNEFATSSLRRNWEKRHDQSRFDLVYIAGVLINDFRLVLTNPLSLLVIPKFTSATTEYFKRNFSE